jgi:hypothetical protein
MGNGESKSEGAPGDHTSPTNQKIKNLSEADKARMDPRIAQYLVERLRAPDREKKFLKIILKVCALSRHAQQPFGAVEEQPSSK